MADAILYAPKVRYANTFESQFDAMMTWRAELELSYCVEDDTPDVLAGYADFLIIRVGEHPMDDLLDSLSEELPSSPSCLMTMMSPARCRASSTMHRSTAF